MTNAKIKKRRQQQEQIIHRLKTDKKKYKDLCYDVKDKEVRANRKVGRTQKTVSAIKLALLEQQKQSKSLVKEKGSIEQDVSNMQLEVIGLEGEVDTLNKLALSDNLFAKTRQSPKGGRMQYPWKMTRVMLEHLVTGASVSAVEKILRQLEN